MASVKFAFCVLLALATSQQAARGSIVNDLISLGLGNGVNFLEDDDFEAIGLDTNPTGVIDEGDRFFGVFRIQGINPLTGGTQLGAGDATITAVFALEVLSTNASNPAVGGDATEITLGPLQSGGANAAIAEFPAFAASLGVTTSSPTDNGTVAILFAHPDLGLTDPGAGSLAASVDTFDTTAGAELIGEFGDGGVFFDASITGGAGIDVPGSDPTPFQGDGSITLNLDQLVDNPLDTLSLGPLFGDGSFVDVVPNVGPGGVVIPAPGVPGDFDLVTDTDFTTIFTQVIPEPTAALIWGMLLSVAGVMTTRRR